MLLVTSKTVSGVGVAQRQGCSPAAANGGPVMKSPKVSVARPMTLMKARVSI